MSSSPPLQQGDYPAPAQPHRSNSNTSRSGGVSLSASTLDSTITRLLIATKGLLEGLAQWSRGEVGADAISAIYVKLGNDFNVACTAFSRENISMTELLSVPSQLRSCLELCLSDTPSQATLERHLPQVRQIIIGLLTGLREKQKQYREGVAARRARDGRGADRRATEDRYQAVSEPPQSRAQSMNSVAPPITPNSASRSRDELRKFVSQAQASQPPPPSSTLPSSRYPPPSAIPPYPPPVPGGLPSGPRPRPSEPPTRRLTNDSESPLPPPPAPGASSRSDQPSRSLSQSSTVSHRDSSRSARATASEGVSSKPPELPPLSSSRSSGSLSTSRRYSGDIPGSPPPPPREVSEPVPLPPTPSADLYPQASIPPPPSFTVRPPSLQSSGSFDETFTPTFEAPQSAKQLESFEALKSSDSLTRRASKRYSAYAIHKITTGSSSPSRASAADGAAAGRELAQSKGAADEKRGTSILRRGKSEFRPTRGPDGDRRMPPVPPLPSSASERDIPALAAVAEEEFHAPLLTASNAAPLGSVSPGTPMEGLANSQPLTDISSTFSPAATTVPPSPSTPGDFKPASVGPPTIEPVSAEPVPGASASRARTSVASESEVDTEYPISVFLQLGRDVKKVKLEETPTIASLRVLFIERFSYNPGHADFPNIYLRDPIVGIQYELEEMGDVKNGSIISLNIDNVEQVKQHIDQGLSGIALEIKELRSTVTAMRRASVSAVNAAATFSPDPHASPVVARPSERQFQDAAQKVLKMKRAASVAGDASSPTVLPSTQLAHVVESSEGPPLLVSPTSSAGGDARAPYIVEALKTQHEEVQNLRQEIAVLRQVYVDFAGQTKGLLANVRTQTNHVHTLAATKVSTARAFIEAGKVKLETVTTDLIARGDTVQDSIDDMRTDISVRKIRPRPGQVNEIAASLKAITKERDDLTAWIATVKPSWKTTWSDELETIISEQKLLEAQEGLLSELQADLEDATKVFSTIQEVVTQPKARGKGAVREFTPAPSDDHQGLSTVLLEVRGLMPDAERRLEAIARAEKAREADLASRTDEFADELGGFVAGGKLKKSGGIEEAERLRQAKSEATLRAMFAS